VNSFKNAKDKFLNGFTLFYFKDVIVLLSFSFLSFPEGFSF
jgi:hypothetical protein